MGFLWVAGLGHSRLRSFFRSVGQAQAWLSLRRGGTCLTAASYRNRSSGISGLGFRTKQLVFESSCHNVVYSQGCVCWLGNLSGLQLRIATVRDVAGRRCDKLTVQAECRQVRKLGQPRTVQKAIRSIPANPISFIPAAVHSLLWWLEILLLPQIREVKTRRQNECTRLLSKIDKLVTVSDDHFHFLTMHHPLAPQTITTYTSTLNPSKTHR